MLSPVHFFYLFHKDKTFSSIYQGKNIPGNKMRNRKQIFKLNESDLKNIVGKVVDKTLAEGYLYHKGYGIDTNNPAPYYSEDRAQKWEGAGHETGSFGSGMYFTSSHPYDARFDDDDKYVMQNSKDISSRFIQLKQGSPDGQSYRNRSALYRVDTDFFSNLYTLKSEQEGDILKNLLNSINSFVRKINYDSNEKYRYDTMRTRQQLYLRIVSLCNTLGLNMPWSYKSFIAFSHSYIKDNTIRQTPATIFMEENGYNGVDATLAGKYDSYWEGSVIYDLNKVKGDITPVRNPRDEFKIRYNDISRTAIDDILDNKTSPRSMYDKSPDILKYLKRYPMVLKASLYISLPESIKPLYLKILYRNIKNGYININDNFSLYNTYGIKELCDKSYISDIIKYNLTNFVNIDIAITKAIFSELSYTFLYDKQTFLNFLNAYTGDMSPIQDDVDYCISMYA